MAITFTPQQQKVIDLHDRNILVSAAAGSGKTAVLVERIVQMVCREEDPVDIDRLLIVTFTNAAAAEMRERISQGITRRLALQPESEHLQRQAALLHNAQITTIDSFCMYLLKNHFHEIGVDPAFRVMDEGERKLLTRDVLAQLLEDRFADGEEDFRYCVEYFCPGGREQVLEAYILGLYEFAESYPWPEEWLEARKADYVLSKEGTLEDTDYGSYLLTHIRDMLESCYGAYRKLQKLCQEPDGPYMYGELIDREMEQLDRLTGLDSLQAYAGQLPALEFGRLPAKKDDTVSPDKRELVKKLRSEIKDVLKRFSDRFFATPLELATAQAAACAGPVNTLIDLTLEFRRRLQQKKQERKLVDFSDMEHFALDILLEKVDGKVVPSRVAREYRRYFKEILIDEYQDSNLVQEYLLKAVSGEDDGQYNRFMVGDVKQSIYKFRLARPELFLDKYHKYTEEDSKCQRIDLSCNFRSRREVVDTVNGIFEGIMSRRTGGIEYDENAALYVGAEYPQSEGCESEMWLVEKPGEKDITDKQAEALTISRRIKELLGTFRVTDKESGELRPVRFSDMVILLRTNSGWDEVFKEVLEEEGIPVYIASKTGYFAAAEVQELLQLLRVLDNPRQDIALFGVMKSLFGGFTEEEIALIRSTCKKGCLYEALEGASQGGTQGITQEGGQETGHLPEELTQKAADFVQRISRYRSYTAYMPIRELLQEVLKESGYLSYVTALPMGDRRRANVEMLLTKASDFEKTSYHGLFHFVRYIEQLEKYDVDYGEAQLLSENADVVRIMSIHKSKGLEFPVTFVAGLSKRFNMQDANRSLIMDVDMGIGTDYVDPVRRIRNKTLRRQVIARKMKEDNLAEELRVLYVALTRPKEKLIMTAVLEDAASTWERQGLLSDGRLAYHEFMESTGYLDFLLPVVRKAGVAVHICDDTADIGGSLKEQIQLADRRERLEVAGHYMDRKAYEQLKEKFRWEYPHRNLQNLYTKTTVSELKIAAMAQKDEAAYHAFEEQELVPYEPRFKRAEEKISGTVRGNAFHKVMELMDFTTVYGGVPAKELADSMPTEMELHKNLHFFLEREVCSKRLSEEYRSAVSERKLVHFLESELAVRMYLASSRGELYREQPFVYGISAGRLGEGYPEQEKVMIQGIIDAFFIEDGEMVLVDYKTDVVASGEELWNRYETQVKYYEEALCDLMGLPMKQKILYSFYLETCVEG